MGVKFKNNAFSELDGAISAVDLGLVVTYGDGPLFPAAGGGDYFYLTLQEASEEDDAAYEIVKVTDRSGDSMTIVRAQEDTTALAWTSGTRAALRVTNQGLLDKFAEDNLSANSVALGDIETIAAAKVLGSIAGGDVSELTAAEVLALIGDTRGNLLYRGASGWTVLAPGTAGQALVMGANDPMWSTGTLLTDGDKGDITVSSSGTAWAIDSAAVTLAKMADLNQYELIGRTSSGAGVPQAKATSSDVWTLLGSADNSTFRSNLGLGTIATQGSGAVAITGGSITALTTLQGTLKASTNTSGTLAAVDADCVVLMTGNCTINGNVFTDRQGILFYSGDSSHTIIEGTSMTMRLGGSSTTGTRTLAARTLAACFMISPTECVVAGQGVT